MIYVLLADHNPEICPTANARVREMMLKTVGDIPNLAKRLGVKIVSGPWANREHLSVLVAEAEKADALDRFVADSGLSQWNRVRVIPSVLMMDEGIKEVEQAKPIF